MSRLVQIEAGGARMSFRRVTPWVGRLIIVNAVVALLLATVLTAARVRTGLTFLPSADAVVSRPWTLLSYMFVHTGVIHLLLTMLLLWFFGPMVEQRMGGRTFLLYYCYAGVGAAVFGLGLSGILPGTIPGMVGATGGALAVALAFAMFWPDAELSFIFFPIPVRARTLILLLAGALVFCGLVFWNSRLGEVTNLAHLGGLLAGYLFLRIQALSQRVPVEPLQEPGQMVMVESPRREPESSLPSRSRPAGPARPDPQAAELDRVLDKINEKGLGSLTSDERRFLDDFARRKKKGAGHTPQDH